MLGYYDVFPEKQSTDLRTVFVADDGTEDSFPPGIYLFTEYYCNVLSCDCQRLLVKCLYLLDKKSIPEEVASFNFTWNENLELPQLELLGVVDNPFLDPLHYQASYAAELMEFWHDMYCKDVPYANRLKSHYEELRTKTGVRTENVVFFLNDFVDSAARRTESSVSESPVDRNRRYKALRKSHSKRSKYK